MTAVVDAADDEGHDPFGDERIELSESELRAVSPAAWLGRVTHRLDRLATKLVYDR